MALIYRKMKTLRYLNFLQINFSKEPLHFGKIKTQFLNRFVFLKSPTYLV